MKSRSVRRLIRKRRREGESIKAAARRLSQSSEENNKFVSEVTEKWLKNKQNPPKRNKPLKVTKTVDTPPPKQGKKK
jgi:hypothetical protein